MLLRFRVSNFASLRDEQELSLIAADDHPDLATQPLPREGLRVLPAVGIFGKNASGKSNVVKALTFAISAIRESHQRWLPEEEIRRWPFQLDAQSRSAPSGFVFELLVDEVRYEYGFEIDDETVRTEWLYAYPRGKKRIWFERDNGSWRFGNTLTGQREFLAEVVRPNSLFLSAAAANNHRQLSIVHRWFTRYRQPSPERVTRLPPPGIQDLEHRLLRLLRYADLGILGARMVPPTTEEKQRYSAFLRQRLLGSSQVDSPEELEPPPRFALVHQADTTTGDATLPWQWESSGTRTWLYLIRPVMSALDTGRLIAIDDLGTGLHPLLTAQLVRLFHDPATNRHGAQLIFNSHDIGLLGRHYGVRLARDQIWLTEKDDRGATRLFPLTEFRVRDGLDDVEGRYLRGRYGAVPFFDEDLLDMLIGTGEPRQ
jgi:AAA15 family ATPase/GTPase